MGLGIEITIIGVLYSIFAIAVQRKLIDTKRLYEMQDVIKAKSKELNDLVKNKASEETLALKQKEITGLLGESMRSSFKPMFVILPIFLVIYYLIFPVVFPTKASITVPVISMTFSFNTYFIIITFVSGMVLSMALMAYDKSKIAKAKSQQVTT
jgi:uncharacterized membrane protein (DUF106 family)